MKTYNHYTQDQKDMIVTEAKNTSFAIAGKKYGINSRLIRVWSDPNIQEQKRQAAIIIRQRKEIEDPEYKNKCRINRTEYLKQNPEKKIKYQHTYQKNNKEQIKQSIKNTRKNNPEKYKQIAKNVYEADKASGQLRERNHRPHNKLKRAIREGVIRSLQMGTLSKSYPSLQYLGCDIPFLKHYIESLWEPWMNWGNHGREFQKGIRCWHIDHIKPLDILKERSDPETMKALCHYTNLRPLEERYNLEKSSNWAEYLEGRDLDNIINYIPQIHTLINLL